MVRVKAQEILSWFNVSRYEELLEFTIDEILKDIEFRIFLLFEGDDSDTLMRAKEMNESRLSFIDGLKKGHINSLSAYLHNLGEGCSESENDTEENIKDITLQFNGWPIVSRDYHNVSKDEPFTSGLACAPFMVGDLISYYNALRRHGYIVDNQNGFVEVQGTHVGREITNVDYLGESFSGEVVIKLNLEEFSDEELITEFKEMIKNWRVESGIDEPDRAVNRVGLSTLKKIITYKVIPFIDLMIWEKACKKKISNEMYARILFPLSEYDYDVISSSQIKDTVKPFIEKIVSNDLLREMIFFVKKNEYLKNMRFSDILKLAEN
ncbi:MULTISPECIES: DUF6387 family protein [Yersinia]|uniref:DUF6387 family protein n=1 Tax=Yersinia TaxID=629 RepID=UPI0005E76815|nr:MULTISPECIES: DUF6387 family protein [Yersinia]MDN0103004.1 DUF6387 family protein [Yersinia bercovieri]CNI88575.1 Uncharacterised protein [Yersinia bercovieri]